MKKIIVGSKNPAKIEAVEQAFNTVWPDEKWDVVGVDVESDVSNQPMTDEESILGATNRARKSLAQNDADFGIGLEGGLCRVNNRWFEYGWIVILSKSGITGIGSTSRIIVPDQIMTLVREGFEVGAANDKIFGRENSKQAEGHFGLMTNNIITRTDAYRDGVIVALASFLHPDLMK